MNPLKSYLQKMDVTYDEFAKIGGWHPRTVFAWANGLKNPSPKNALLIETLTIGAIKALEMRMVKKPSIGVTA